MRRAWIAAWAMLLAAGCGDNPAGGGVPLDVRVDGRAERGSVVRVRVLRGGVAVPEARVTWSPADAVHPLGGDSVRLRHAGTAVVTASAEGMTEARTLEVAAPPTVVFDREVDGNRDLWRVALDGDGLARLTADSAGDADPTVAGGRIVFVSYRADANAELFSMPLGGGEATRLTRTAAAEAMPALSRDGRQLAYTADGGGTARLWLAAGDGTGGARASTSTAFAIEASPAWAPGGSLAFTSTALGTSDVFSLSGRGAPTLLAGGTAAEVEPAWSADGALLAFASARVPGAGTDIHLLRVATGEVTRLTRAPADEGQPAWTADGRLVYTEFTPEGPRLRWIDPADPERSHAIDTGPGPARNPAVIP